VRAGARQMLAAALQAEVAAYVDAFADQLDENGRRLVVRNGYHAAREVTTAAGAVPVRAPRVNDKRTDETTGQRQRFSSAILPAWSRKSPRIAEVLPLLYLHGLSTSDFGPALEQFLGTSHGLSAATITRLTKDWQDEAAAFTKRSLKETDYVYVWVDGIHLKVRLEQDRVCLLVMIGVRADGTKELIALDDGHRESTESWADLLRSCKRRGMRAPVLAVGDGALGFWAAVREVFPGTREQRCWFHRERKESIWSCRGLGAGERVKDRCGVGVSGVGRQRGVTVLGQDRADFSDDVTDGASADVEQFGEGVLGAQLALVQDSGQDAFVVGDLLGENAPACAGKAFSAAPSVAVPLVACLEHGADPFAQCDQVGAGHAGQFRGGKEFRCLCPDRDGLAA
jgi:Transposase, Mutator family